MTAQGHPRTIFRRAIERGNLVIAETAAREAGNLTLAEALGLLCLYAAAQDAKFERAAVKWLGRFVEERSPSLLRVHVALAALSELRGGSETAERMLREQLVEDRILGWGNSREGRPFVATTDEGRKIAEIRAEVAEIEAIVDRLPSPEVLDLDDVYAFLEEQDKPETGRLGGLRANA